MDPTSQELGALPVDVAKVRKISQVRRATATSFFALGLRRGHGEPNQLDTFAAANADGTWIYDFE